jgi:hypothetical protein
MKTAKYLIYVLAVCCVLLQSGCRRDSNAKTNTAYEIDNVYQQGPLTVHVRVDKGRISLAQTLWLELAAAIPPGCQVKMPQVGDVLKDFGIVDWQKVQDRLDADNNVVTAYKYRLEPFSSGSLSIPAFEFKFSDVNSPNQPTHHLDSEPLDIQVTSLLAADRNDLKIADIEGVVPMPGQRSYLWLAISGALVLVGGGALAVVLRRGKLREAARIFKPAHEIAYERLDALARQQLIEKGQIKLFYERISDILRHYIEDRFELRAPEQTTEEFLAALAATNVLGADDKGSLAEFLQHCDLVKFAKYRPQVVQIRKAFDLVKDFIEKTRSDERKIDVTDSVNKQDLTVAGV